MTLSPEEVHLTDVAEVNPRASLGDVPLDESVAFVPMSAMSAEHGVVTATEHRNVGDVRKGFTPFHDGDVLIAKITPCFENGKIGQVRIPTAIGFGSTEFHVVRPHSEKLDGRYLHHFLRQDRVRHEGERRMTGSAGQRRVPAAFVSNLQLRLPPLAEQRRIADILDKADALRAQRRAALAELETLTQSIFLDLFGDPVANPKAWSLKSLKELGIIKTGGTPPSTKPGMFGGAVPFVTPGDLESNDSVKRTVTEEGANQAVTVRAGATLVCCIGATIGKMGNTIERSAFNQQLNAVEWTAGMNDDYGLNTLRFFKSQIARWGASTTLPILKKSSFEKIEIPVPPLELQADFARRITAVETLKSRHRAALADLDALFASLQCRAFRGAL